MTDERPPHHQHRPSARRRRPAYIFLEAHPAARTAVIDGATYDLPAGQPVAISLATGRVYWIKATKASRRNKTYVLKAIGGEPIFAVPAHLFRRPAQPLTG